MRAVPARLQARADRNAARPSGRSTVEAPPTDREGAIRLILYVSSATGSVDLAPHLERAGAQVVLKRCNTDIEFLGFGPAGPSAIGIEHKSAVTSDIFDSMQSGRLVGTQMPVMVRHYQWLRYVIIEGNLRRAKDGLLEIKKWGGGQWEPAYSRNGKGWMWDEYRKRIESLQEFFSEPHCAGRTMVVETYDVNESVAFVLMLQAKWSRPYEDHASHLQWDRSRRRESVPVNPFVPTSERDLTQLWASDIDGIGAKKSAYLARHFGPRPIRLANATIEEWRQVRWQEQRKGQFSMVEKKFSDEQIQRIMKQIGSMED